MPPPSAIMGEGGYDVKHQHRRSVSGQDGYGNEMGVHHGAFVLSFLFFSFIFILLYSLSFHSIVSRSSRQ